MAEPAETEQPVADNTRSIEASVVTDFSDRMSYGGYLDLPTLLAAQRPISRPEHHDELLFIIQHQTTELWLKLVLHELETRPRPAARRRARPGAQVRRPREAHPEARSPSSGRCSRRSRPPSTREFRGVLGNASGFQSYQYRAVEFVLGNKNAKMLQVFESDAAATAILRHALEAPSIYDEFLRLPRPHRLPDPGRDPRARRDRGVDVRPELVPVFARIYENADEHWAAYETCEELVDLEDNFQLWRFRHLKTVRAHIGMKTGTGGSSGAPFLQKALELTFFPELYAVRTEIPALTDDRTPPTHDRPSRRGPGGPMPRPHRSRRADLGPLAVAVRRSLNGDHAGEVPARCCRRSSTTTCTS